VHSPGVPALAIAGAALAVAAPLIAQNQEAVVATVMLGLVVAAVAAVIGASGAPRAVTRMTGGVLVTVQTVDAVNSEPC
jgi:hypothetical protein